MNGSVEFIRFADITSGSTKGVVSTRNIFVHEWGSNHSRIGTPFTNKDISSGDDVLSTFQSDVGEADKLNTTIDGYLTEEWNTASSRN